MKMRFGAHRGAEVCDLPDEYLTWLSSIELREPLRSEVHKTLREREAKANPTPAVAAGLALHIVPGQARCVREIIDAGYRSLALKLHPDCGGSTAKMQLLNSIVEDLREQLGRAA